jgi:transposase
VLPLKAEVVRREAARHLEDLPGWSNTVIGDLLSEVHHLDERIAQYDAHIRAMAKESTPARQLMQSARNRRDHGHGDRGHGRQRP